MLLLMIAGAMYHLDRRADGTWSVGPLGSRTRYVVTPADGGGGSCSCPARARGTGRFCKHVSALIRLRLLEDVAPPPRVRVPRFGDDGG
jgi:hypothetical protein